MRLRERGRQPAVPRVWLATAAALGVVAVGLAMYGQSLRQEMASLRIALDAQSAARRAAVARSEALESQTEELESRMATLTSPDAQPVSLTGQDAAAEARARAFLDRENSRVLLYVYDLPPLPPGQTYQLWVIVDGMPISAGTFDVAPDGTARYDAEPITTLSAEQSVAIAVTAEAAGGVPAANGTIGAHRVLGSHPPFRRSQVPSSRTHPIFKSLRRTRRERGNPVPAEPRQAVPAARLSGSRIRHATF